ncbi:MAG: phosphoribosyl-AMP cyclohydrolase [Ktedonobacteraceae bacterium]|nr:phosphoribosyl-AMP cyclohydrolase [Ktedonobacteraceae bacterium]
MLKFDRQGLIPVVIQDDATADVLMVAFMNEEALQLTRQTGYTHFFSRSRNRIWRKGEQSGNVQEVRAIFVNCEENSLLVRVVQRGKAACHEGYYNCYYRRLLPDGSYETVAERIFDPEEVYGATHSDSSRSVTGSIMVRQEIAQRLEASLTQLYSMYLYLRDHDLSEQSNTSRLLQERSHSYLVARLVDELQELADVQSGEHVHAGREPDTVLEGSQVGYWLFLIAASNNLDYDEFTPHVSLLSGYDERSGAGKVVEQRQQCLKLLSSTRPSSIVSGLHLGFALIGWACAEARVSPLAPADFDLQQMRRKGLVK